MSMPSIPNINPNINIVRDDAINLIIASIAMEELALAHILNAEGEKIQYILGTLEGRDPGEVTLCDIMEVNNSVHRTLRDVIKEEMLLQLKLEDAIELSGETAGCQLTIRGQKIWRDGNNIANTRPASVTINLMRDNELFRTATTDAANNWAYTFGCLPVWRDGENRYTYRVEEAALPARYTSVVSGYSITNTIDEGSIDINGSKRWDDYDNAAGRRPATIQVSLLQNGLVIRNETVASPPVGEDTADFGFAGLPQFDANGTPYVYTVDENLLDDYVKVITGYDIVNTIGPVTMTVGGNKIWNDNNNAAQDRPDSIIVHLLQNGIRIRQQVLPRPDDAVDTLPFSFADLPVLDAQGVRYAYTVEEDPSPIDNYTSVITGNADDGYNIENTHN